MRRQLAYAFYLLGVIFALISLTSNAGGFAGTLFGIVGAVAVWWIACGFGVRLGVTPDEFATSVKTVLGFGVDYEVEREPSPQAPSERP